MAEVAYKEIFASNFVAGAGIIAGMAVTAGAIVGLNSLWQSRVIKKTMAKVNDSVKTEEVNESKEQEVKVEPKPEH